jgi:succinyl-diaminopimelate desuccinylase
VSAVVELTRQLVAVPSVSGEEQAIAGLVERRLRTQVPAMTLRRIGNTVVGRTDRGCAQRVLLAGHLDTVPDSGNCTDDVPHQVSGLGAVDMKGGLAVLLLAAEGRCAYDLTVVCYDREETGSRGSGMHVLAEQHRDLLAADLAVVLEPTDGWLEAGCQGNLVVELAFAGRRAHTARPWTGDNAIHRAAPALSRLAAWQPRPVTLDGLAYRQAFSVVGVTGGVQGNVVPDRCTVKVNYRHAPSLDSGAALATVTELAPEADEVRVVLDSPAAPPRLDTPLLQRLRADLPVRPKLGWTDVGRFAQLGIPAVNFGPGDPERAHMLGEVVTRAALERCLDILSGFLGGG